MSLKKSFTRPSSISSSDSSLPFSVKAKRNRGHFSNRPPQITEVTWGSENHRTKPLVWLSRYINSIWASQQKTAVEKFDSVIFVEKSSVFHSALRLRCIYSSDETFKQRSNELKSYLNKRGNNSSFLNQEVARAHNVTRTQALAPKDTSKN